jgi:AcrR family transcriptional regulator
MFSKAISMDDDPSAGSGKPPRPHTRFARPRQRARTQTRIVRAAHREFLERSYFDSRVDDVVKRANVSRAVAYLHFRDKQDLLEAAIRYEIGISQRLMTRANLPEQPSDADLERWVWRYVRSTTSAIGGVRLMNLGAYIKAEIGAIAYQSLEKGLLTLAQKTRAFRIVDEAGTVDEVRLVELNLILWEAGQLALAVGYGTYSEQRAQIAVNSIVRRLRAFLNSP